MWSSSTYVGASEIGIIIDGKLYYGKSGYSAGIWSHARLQQRHHLPLRKNRMRGDGSVGKSTQEKVDRTTPGWQTIHSLRQGGEPKGRADLARHSRCHRQRRRATASPPLQKVADELGKQLAGVINIFNPEMLVIGGEMSATGDSIALAGSNMGIKKFSLNIMNEDSKIVTSTLKAKPAYSALA